MTQSSQATRTQQATATMQMSPNGESRQSSGTDQGNVRFSYHEQDGRVLTVCRSLSGTPGQMRQVRVGWSCRNPVDQMSKQLARTIAVGRMNNPRSQVVLNLTENEQLSGMELEVLSLMALRNRLLSRHVQKVLVEQLDVLMDKMMGSRVEVLNQILDRQNNEQG
jgi:hypothetical protein